MTCYNYVVVLEIPFYCEERSC